MVQVEQSVRYVCVYEFGRQLLTKTTFDLDIWHAGSFKLTLSRSSSNVRSQDKVHGHRRKTVAELVGATSTESSLVDNTAAMSAKGVNVAIFAGLITCSRIRNFVIAGRTKRALDPPNSPATRLCRCQYHAAYSSHALRTYLNANLVHNRIRNYVCRIRIPTLDHCLAISLRQLYVCC